MRPKLRRLLKIGRAGRVDADAEACFGDAGGAAGDGVSRARSPSLLHPLSVLPVEANAAGGTVLLRRFVAAFGGRDLSGRAPLRERGAWHYSASQGSLPTDLARVRAQLDPRLYRAGGLLSGGGWCRLLLGGQYAGARARGGAHFLHLAIAFCACVRCLAVEAADEQDVPDLPQSLSALRAFERLSLDETPPASPRDPRDRHPELELPCLSVDSDAGAVNQEPHFVENVELPTPKELFTLAGGASACEYELGWVVKGGARSSKIKLFYTPQVEHLLRHYSRYAGPVEAEKMAAAVMRLALEYYTEQPKNKSDRKFYIQGKLYRFCVAMGAHPARLGAEFRPHPVTGYEQQPLGVVFKRQMVVLFYGRIVLETGIGTFMSSDETFYLGFGEDGHGAQTVFRDGELGPARHLGFNELLAHIPFARSEQREIIMK